MSKSCAGVLFTTKDKKHLFLKRAAESSHGGTWGIPGGTGEDGETPWQTASRETREEIGVTPRGHGGKIDHSDDGKVAFTTFDEPVDDTFKPTLNDEHTEHTWATEDDLPEPLHPGVAATMKKLKRRKRVAALAKFFDGSKHERDKLGRFTDHGHAPSMTTQTVAPAAMRSLHRASSVWRTGARTKELPIEYTGSRQKEHEAGTFLMHKFTPQIPRLIEPKQWMKLMRGLGNVAKDARTPTVDKALTEGIWVNTHRLNGPKRTLWTVPPGTTRASLNRAYTHATKLALHDYGVADYDFKMDDHLKAEMRPLIPFIRYARRFVKGEMFATHKGQWKPFRAEFGHTFKDLRTDKRRGSETFGQVRRRTRANEVLVKSTPMGAPPPALKPNVLPPAPGLSRFDRYRAAIAQRQAQGLHAIKPLTFAQKFERVRAARTFARKKKADDITVRQGMPGSLAGTGIDPRIDAERDAMKPPRTPRTPGVPMAKQAPAQSSTYGWRRDRG